MANLSFRRSVFDLSFQNELTLAPNMITPIYSKRVEPGETLKVVSDHFLRFNNLLVPVFDRLKIGVFTFYVRDRDVYRYAGNVYGEVSSQRTKNIKYRNPYICTSLAPWFQGRSIAGLNSDNGGFANQVLYDFVGNQIYNLASSTPPTEAQKTAFKELMSKPIKMVQKGLEFNVPPAPIPLPALNIVSDTNLNSRKKIADMVRVMFNDTPFTWHPGGLGDYLYGNVGSKYLFLNAYKAMSYFKIFDDFFRPADLLDPLFAVDDKNEFVINRTELARFQNITGNNGTSTTAIRAYAMPYNALCDNYSEEQIGISQVMATNYVYLSTNVENFKEFDSSKVLSRGNDFKTYLFATGGLCPAFKYPDYFGLAGLAPSEININVLNGVDTAQTVVPINTYPYSQEVSGQLVNSNASGATGEVGVVWDNTYATPTDDLSVTLTDNQTIAEFIAKCKLQQFLDISHLAGTRYFEIVKAMNGVEIPDNQLGRAQLLSMDSSVFDIIPVVQSSGTADDSTPQGTLTANGVARVTGGGFYKTFPEHGTVIMVIVPRSVNIYQERVKREDLVFERMDYRYSIFAKLGEQPIYNVELHVPKMTRSLAFSKANASDENLCVYDRPDFIEDNTSTATDRWNIKASPAISHYLEQNFKPYGYNERYSDAKYSNNEVHGLFRSRAELMSNVAPDFQDMFNNARGSFDGFGSLSLLLQNENKDLSLVGDFLSQYNGTQDYWTYAYDHDIENQYYPAFTENMEYYALNNGLNDVNPVLVNPETYKSSLPKASSIKTPANYVIQSATPPLNWTFLLAQTPWRRSSVALKQQPLQMLCRFKITTALPYPVTVKPGQNTI